MKQAVYKKIYSDGYGYNYYYKPVELTGLCKKIEGGQEGGYRLSPRHQVQVQRRIFGIRCGKYWWDRDSIEFRDPIIETIYTCEDVE